MNNLISPRQYALIGVKAIAGFIVAVLFLFSLPVVLVWPKYVFILLHVLALLLAIPLYLVRRVYARHHDDYSARGSYALISLGTLITLVVLLALPVYYLAYVVDTRPTVVPHAVLSDGKKSVVFQGMMHVGSEDFYKGVVYDLEKALTEGYTLFYEGVQPSASEEANTWFKNTLAGGRDLSANYKALADLCGMNFQLDYFGPLEADKKLHPERHVIADVSYREMYDEYRRLAQTDAGFAQAWDKATKKGADGAGDNFEDKLTAWAMHRINESTAGQKYVAGVLCRGVMSTVMSKIGPQGDAKDPVILDLRNRYLAGLIAASPIEKIYITYGGAHLPGTLQELQKIDPGWKIASMKWTRAIAAPEHLEGALISRSPQ